MASPQRISLLIRVAESLALVIPSFESAKYLPDLFSSIWGGESSLGLLSPQTLLPTEVIVVDDCSSDNTEAVVDEYRKVHSELVYLRLNKNRGTPTAMNEGVKAANSAYITRIDSDDMREPESFERMMEAQLANPHSLIYDNIKIFLKGQRQNQTWVMEDYDFDLLLERNFIHAGVMYPKQAWVDCGGYPEEFVHGRDDWSFNVAMGISGYCGVRVDYPGYLYRREQQNRSLRNQSSAWQKEFSDAMHSKFAEVYSGERKMGCCGNRKNRVQATSKSSGTQVAQQIVAGETGMTVLQYQGGNAGSENYYGPVTGAAYRFSSSKSKKNVDNRDLHTDKGKGLLDLHVGSKPIFVVAP